MRTLLFGIATLALLGLAAGTASAQQRGGHSSSHAYSYGHGSYSFGHSSYYGGHAVLPSAGHTIHDLSHVIAPRHGYYYSPSVVYSHPGAYYSTPMIVGHGHYSYGHHSYGHHYRH